ncbi:MAG TPA: hypothetical protein VFN30_08380 [Chitinophagaceae bacterium]|nr:hypothetical protein [Chitinophagaceae bacterium]
MKKKFFVAIPWKKFCFFFLSAVSIISFKNLHAQNPIPFRGEIIKTANLPPCPPEVTGRLLYTETDRKGNKFEIFCNGQYQAKITRADGKVVYVGKCPFPRGHNTFRKKVDVSGFIIKRNDSLIVNITSEDSITRTFWKSVFPVGLPPASGSEGPVGTGEDKLWVYDVGKDSIAKQKTKHTGRWKKIKIDQDSVWTWVVDSQTADGPPSFEKAPGSSSGLDFASIPGGADTTWHAMYQSDFVSYSPVPITAMDGNTPVTFTMRLPINSSTYIVNSVNAFADSLFLFDIQMPHEEERAVSYSFDLAPEGMNIDSVTGVINWLPNQSQSGNHKVRVKMKFYNSDPVIDEFILTVKTVEATEKKKNYATWIIVFISLLLLFLLFLKRKKS